VVTLSSHFLFKDKCDLTYANGIQNNAFTITEEKISNGDSLKNGNVTKDFKDIEKTMPNAISFEKTSYKPGIILFPNFLQKLKASCNILSSENAF
jgi:hypothetical protein